ncbi:MAG: cation:proton antiporter [Planctomycetaceae bacterium]|nr:cation:proton antiporter [Planctomycetaceae bacterium]
MLNGANDLLILAVILVAGTTSAAIARRLSLPSVTGQIIAGVLMGSVFQLMTEEQIHGLGPLVDFALGLMAVAVGSHLNFRRLFVARRRLILLLLMEATVTPLIVFSGVVIFTDVTWYTALLLATITVSTAPATVLALVKETASKGAFVTTLIAAVALNNLACIILFEVARTLAAEAVHPTASTVMGTLMVPMSQIGRSMGVGIGAGVLLIIATRHVVRTDRLSAFSLIAILLTTGLSAHLGLSVLLACLFLGVTLANLTPDREEIGHKVFEGFESAIFAVFFTVAGMELKFDKVLTGGLLAAVVFSGRLMGKTAAGYFAMRLAGATDRFRRWIGISLAPQAGLAVGLMLLITEDPGFSSIHELFLTIVLATVLLNESVGPILTRTGLKRSGDFGKDRARVLDFLSEVNITTELKGPDKESAIRQLIELTTSVHNLKLDSDEIFAAVMQGETAASTCVGEGLALPHARIDAGDRIVGAMGISRQGLMLDAVDGKPVHCMVLILTPSGMPERHLEVLSALASSIGRDRGIQHQLYHIDSPAHADELIHLDRQFEDWNYYLEDESD